MGHPFKDRTPKFTQIYMGVPRNFGCPKFFIGCPEFLMTNRTLINAQDTHKGFKKDTRLKVVENINKVVYAI